MNSGVTGKQVQIALSLAGGISALIGALLLSLVSIPTMLAELQSRATSVPEPVTYVSGDGNFRACMSCHTDVQWSNSVRPLEINGEILNPHAVNDDAENDQSGEWAYRMNTTQGVRPFLSTEIDFPSSYILRGSMEEQTP